MSVMFSDDYKRYLLNYRIDFDNVFECASVCNTVTVMLHDIF